MSGIVADEADATTTKKSATKKRVTKKTGTKGTSKSMPKAGEDPKGGLTAVGRKFLNETEGSHLRPGVRGAADTPEKKKRKGSFLTRHFTHPRGPMEKDGEPTRLSLSAQAWGEPMPKTETEAKALAVKGRRLLEAFHADKDGATPKKRAVGKTASKREVDGVRTRSALKVKKVAAE